MAGEEGLEEAVEDAGRAEDEPDCGRDVQLRMRDAIHVLGTDTATRHMLKRTWEGFEGEAGRVEGVERKALTEIESRARAMMTSVCPLPGEGQERSVRPPLYIYVAFDEKVNERKRRKSEDGGRVSRR